MFGAQRGSAAGAAGAAGVAEMDTLAAKGIETYGSVETCDKDGR